MKWNGGYVGRAKNYDAMCSGYRGARVWLVRADDIRADDPDGQAVEGRRPAHGTVTPPLPPTPEAKEKPRPLHCVYLTAGRAGSASPRNWMTTPN